MKVRRYLPVVVGLIAAPAALQAQQIDQKQMCAALAGMFQNAGGGKGGLVLQLAPTSSAVSVVSKAPSSSDSAAGAARPSDSAAAKVATDSSKPAAGALMVASGTIGSFTCETAGGKPASPPQVNTGTPADSTSHAAHAADSAAAKPAGAGKP